MLGLADMRKLVWVREKDRFWDWAKLRARCTGCGWAGDFLPNALMLAQVGKSIEKVDRELRRERSLKEFKAHRCTDFPVHQSDVGHQPSEVKRS